MTEYFNIMNIGPKGAPFALFGFAFIFIGIVVLIFSKNIDDTNVLKPIIGEKRKYNPKFIRGFFKIWTGFAIFWTVIATTVIFGEYFNYRSVIKNSDFAIVEGIVTNFDPMPYSGHKHESFTVNGISFEYSDYEISNGFNQTKSHGGPIDEGKYVKIYYYKGTILRLWVRDDAN